MRNVTCFINPGVISMVGLGLPPEAQSAFYVKSHLHLHALKVTEKCILFVINQNLHVQDREKWLLKDKKPGMDELGTALQLLETPAYIVGPPLVSQPPEARYLFDLIDKAKEFVGCMAQASPRVNRSPKKRAEWRERAAQHFRDLVEVSKESNLG